MLSAMNYAPDWPPPPLLTHYLLESPWLVCVTLLTVAAALALIGWRGGQRRPMIASAIAACLAGVLFLVAMLVQTDRERMAQRARAMVDAAASPVNLELFGETLSEDATFFGRDRDAILGMLQRSAHRWQVSQAYITRLEVHQDDATRGQTYLSIITRLNTSFGGGSAQTRWLLHWRKEPDGVWRIRRIEWLSLNDRDAREGDLP